MAKLNVLLTGAAGRVGQVLLPGFQERYELRCFDRVPAPGATQALVGSLTDLAAARKACAGVEVVVHLAATPGLGDFVAELVPNNIVGVYHILEAAREAKVRRVVYASSGQVGMGYPRGRRVEADEPFRPLTVYGATKAFGEILGRYYHDFHGLEFVALRLGSVLPADSEHLKPGERSREVWLSHGDARELFQRAVEQPGLGYAAVYGTSITERERLGRKAAREVLGFEPRDTLAESGSTSWKTEESERS